MLDKTVRSVKSAKKSLIFKPLSRMLFGNDRRKNEIFYANITADNSLVLSEMRGHTGKDFSVYLHTHSVVIQKNPNTRLFQMQNKNDQS